MTLSKYLKSLMKMDFLKVCTICNQDNVVGVKKINIGKREYDPLTIRNNMVGGCYCYRLVHSKIRWRINIIRISGVYSILGITYCDSNSVWR